MGLYVHPNNVIVQSAVGDGDMVGLDDVNGTCRFSLDVDRYVIVFVRATYSGGSSTADLTMSVDSIKDDSRLDHALLIVEAAGVDNTESPSVNIRISADEWPSFFLSRGDVFCLDWTNPNTQRWGVEVGLADTSLIVSS